MNATKHLPDFAETKILWLLRVGAAGCFIGHGAFGVITKAAWLPYFGVTGIDGSAAWHLMPLIGTLDITLGVTALLWPTTGLFAFMTIWATWTAMLRPLAGEPVWEMIERAGNYGVPLALIVAGAASAPFTRATRNEIENDLRKWDVTRWVLRIATAALLAGHAGLGLFTQKPGLTDHYAALGVTYPAALTPAIGAFEFLLAALVLFKPHRWLLFAICGWKIGSESLFLLQGSPAWEVIERFGSYACPLVLALLVPRNVPPSPRLSFPVTAESS